MPRRASPKDGDVVVREETREGTVVYLLSTAPGGGQYLLHAREEAIVQAVTFAKRHGVRAWVSDEREGCVLLNTFPVKESV